MSAEGWTLFRIASLNLSMRTMVLHWPGAYLPRVGLKDRFRVRECYLSLMLSNLYPELLQVVHARRWCPSLSAAIVT
jgi:hypothetical protein